MKILTVASSTFGSFIHNRIIVALSLLFTSIFLLGLYGVLLYKARSTIANSEQIHSLMMADVAKIMFLLAGLGNVVAAWASADSITREIGSGTILAVMARPLRRWQFLAGKYIGVLMLMSVYSLSTLGTTYFLTWLGGQLCQTSWWILFVYPLVRYAIWAGIGLFLSVLLNPAVVMGIVAILLSLIQLLGTGSALNAVPKWIRLPLHLVLPLTTSVLSDDRFFTMTQADLRRYSWTDHMTALAYGLDYALMCFLLGVAMFQRRSLARD